MADELPLFPAAETAGFAERFETRGKKSLEQYFTPAWAADLLLRRYFPGLCSQDFVVDSGAGRGPFLGAIPHHVPAIGVEIDSDLAAFAADQSGRDVLCGDFRTVELPQVPTVIVGNPPFSRRMVDGFLARAHHVLPPNGRVGYILPAHVFSYSGPFLRWKRDWSMQQEIIPRQLFHRMSIPLVFCLFTKEHVRRIHGFFLFEEAEEIQSSSPAAKLVLMKGGRRRSVWRAVVDQAFTALGGRASTAQLRDFIAPRRPTGNVWWKDKIRQVLNEGPYVRVGDHVWERRAA